MTPALMWPSVVLITLLGVTDKTLFLAVGRRPGAGRKPMLKVSTRTTVRIEDRDLGAIERLAQHEGTTVSEQIRRAIKRYAKYRVR